MAQKQHKDEAKKVRLLGYEVARLLTEEEIDQIGGGSTSCCSGKADDCDPV